MSIMMIITFTSLDDFHVRLPDLLVSKVHDAISQGLCECSSFHGHMVYTPLYTTSSITNLAYEGF